MTTNHVSPVKAEEEETVTITKQYYQAMQDGLAWLQALEDAGVDNWSGYDYAREAMEEE